MKANTENFQLNNFDTFILIVYRFDIFNTKIFRQGNNFPIIFMQRPTNLGRPIVSLPLCHDATSWSRLREQRVSRLSIVRP